MYGWYGGKVLTRHPNPAGYLTVHLSRQNKARTHLVHNLVMLAFAGARPSGMVICHNDGDKNNCALSNLRYDTGSANEKDKKRHGRNYQLNKEECPNGHPYNQENTYINPNTGKRFCKTCARIAARKQYHQRKIRQEAAQT